MAQPETSVSQPAPTGARNESSVLFSPSQLGMLASRAGAGTEGSGLIDIRTLASSLPRAGAQPSASSRADEVLGIGSVPIGATLLAAPVPMPTNPRRGRAIVAAAALASGGMMIAASVIALAITRTHAFAGPLASSPPIVAAADGAAPSETSIGDEAVRARVGEPPSTPPPEVIERVVVTDARTEAPARDDARTRADRVVPVERTRRERTARDHGPEREAVARDDGTPPEETRAPGDSRARSERESTLGELVDDVFDERRVEPRAREEAAETLPATPSRAEIVRALDAVRPAVNACGGGEHGNAVVSITIAGPTGRVASATVTGTFAGAPAGTCIARAVRGATFPRFARPSLTIQFPFRI